MFGFPGGGASPKGIIPSDCPMPRQAELLADLLVHDEDAETCLLGEHARFLGPPFDR